MKLFRFMLIFLPLSLAARYLHLDPGLLFSFACLSIVPLAVYMSQATETLADHAGPKIGGLLNVTFGNAAELIIAFFALKEGLYDVVKASIAGSVMGNILLVLGFSMALGGVRHRYQTFSRQTANLSANMLTFAIIGLCVPAVFVHSLAPASLDSWQLQPLSIGIAAIMLGIYMAGLAYPFIGKTVFSNSLRHNKKPSNTSLKRATAVLALTASAIAVGSELLVGSIEPVTQTWGISPVFIGIILIPIIGNAAEHATAVWMAWKNNMDLAVEIAVGSCLQITLFVMPILVLIGAFIGKPLSIVFSQFELISLVVSALIVTRVTEDAESNWLEGIQLLAVYAIIAACFFWLD